MSGCLGIFLVVVGFFMAVTGGLLIPGIILAAIGGGLIHYKKD